LYGSKARWWFTFLDIRAGIPVEQTANNKKP
jgi:hypothetical protein